VNAPCAVLTWDSEFFGRRIGRVESHRLSAAAVADVLAWTARERIECLYLLADSDDATTLHLAETAGFHCMGVRVELDQRLGTAHEESSTRAGATTGRDDVTLRPVRAADRDALLAIARVNHVDTRFYADPRFPTAQADALYARWVERSCFDSYSGNAFVADIAGTAVGYLTASVKGTNGIIDLLGVSAAERGRGLGRRLIAHALEWFRAQGATTASVVTQGRNIAAQRLYQQAGFRTSQVHLWYHRWSNPQ
jgi:dTDP-4-amino-4,6-dideoxy-D-galactose acyltransferase